MLGYRRWIAASLFRRSSVLKERRNSPLDGRMMAMASMGWDRKQDRNRYKSGKTSKNILILGGNFAAVFIGNCPFMVEIPASSDLSYPTDDVSPDVTRVTAAPRSVAPTIIQS